MIALAAVVLTLPSIITVSALTLTNPSLLLPNSTTANANYAYKCSGDSQGRNLDSASCMEALRQIDATSTRQLTWGQRGTGLFDMKLPKRYTSCSSSHPSIWVQKKRLVRTNYFFSNASERTLCHRATPCLRIYRSCKSTGSRCRSPHRHKQMCQHDAISGWESAQNR